MTGRAVRRAALGVVTLQVAGVLVAFAVAVGRPQPMPVPVRVVESRCIDGRITQGIDDGNPAGWLAYDTGVSC